MILLDTNVVSETMQPRPNAEVLAWLDHQSAETLLLSAITVAELHVGIARMRPSKKRERLTFSVERKILPMFINRILSFDLSCTQHYAEIVAACTRAGSPIHQPDTQIAAIAKTYGLVVATRDIRPFLASGLEVINPWAHPAS